MAHKRVGLFYCFGPFLSVRVCDIVVDLSVEFVYMWISKGSGLESITFSNESLGDVGVVRHHVGDVTLGDVLRRR